MKLGLITYAEIRRIEDCLAGLEEVEDASVWFDESNIMAQVRLNANSRATELTLRSHCMAVLEPELVPKRILVFNGRPRAVVHVSPK